MPRSSASILVALLLAYGSLPGQCATQAQSLGGIPGASQWVFSTTQWDPDGPGPAGAVSVIGGMFSVAGTAVANGIAWYDAAADDWRSFGTGVGAGSGMAGYSIGSVSALLPLPNGDLIAGGVFPSAGGVAAANIAVWRNGAWAPLGAGLNGPVNDLVQLPTGEIVAGGSFTSAGGLPASNLAVWNGTSWSQFASSPPGAVSHLAVLTNGTLAAAGQFGLSIWNGAWTAVGLRPVRAIAASPAGGLIWSSSYMTLQPFPQGTEVPFVGQTVGGATSYLLTGVVAHAFEWLPNGDLLAALESGFGTAVRRWNGTSWTPFTTNLSGPVSTIARMPNGDLLAGGLLERAGNVAVNCVAAWDGQNWRRLGKGLDNLAPCLVELPGGDLVVGGGFGFGGDPAALVAKWNGSQWAGLGTFVAVPSTVFIVSALATLPNGNLVAGGSFSAAGGVAAANVARWDGASWWPMGAGSSNPVHTAITTSSGQVVVGSDGVFGWTGSTWSTYGNPGDGFVRALAEAQNGDLVAAGSFSTIGGVSAQNIARWTGTAWQPLGSGLNNDVFAVACLTNGDIVATGWFTTAGGAPASHIARWDGVAWSPLGTGIDSVGTSLLALPNGDLLAAGGFLTAGGVPVERLARWDGASWSPFGGGLDDIAQGMRLLSNGEIAVSGRFTAAGGIAAGRVVRFASTCPATTTVTGAGCTGAGGPNVLVALSRPWIGSAFRARATGLAPTSLALGVFGLAAASVPLSTILPQGLAGCTLLATPDLLDVRSVNGGVANTQLAIPNVVALVGQVVHHQLVALEIGANGSIVAR